MKKQKNTKTQIIRRRKLDSPQYKMRDDEAYMEEINISSIGTDEDDVVDVVSNATVLTPATLPVSCEDLDRPTVMGRDLHEALGIDTRYNDWFKRMCEYGFVEGEDYYSILSNRSDGLAGKSRTDHQLTIAMAKEICMLQRSDQGKQCRQYFLELEKKWNSPETIMARALQMSNRQLIETQAINKELNAKIEEMEPKVTYCDMVLKSAGVVSTNVIAKDYGKTARWLNVYLEDKKIQYKQGKLWLLHKRYAAEGYMKTMTVPTNSYDAEGNPYTSVHSYWTQKGRMFIYEVLKADGILPLMEAGKCTDVNAIGMGAAM